MDWFERLRRMAYPQWQHFPRHVHHPGWVDEILAIVGSAQGVISTENEKNGPKSDVVLSVLRPDLVEMGFQVETGKGQAATITRPVLFGENGKIERYYDIDAFREEDGIALEVEAGRAAYNNADYRDIVRTSLLLDANFLVLLVPITYRSKSGSKTVCDQTYSHVRSNLDAIYASPRLKLPFEGVLLVGY